MWSRCAAALSPAGRAPRRIVLAAPPAEAVLALEGVRVLRSGSCRSHTSHRADTVAEVRMPGRMLLPISEANWSDRAASSGVSLS